MPSDPRNTTASGVGALNRRVSKVADRTYTVPGGRVAYSYIVVGDNIDDEAVDTKHIVAESVTAEKIEAGSITAEKIAANAVIAEKINANAVTTVKLDAKSVTAEKIASGVITAEHIEAGSIDTEQLAAEAVTAAKIEAGSITADRLETGELTAEYLSVTELSTITADMGELTAGTITGALIRTGAEGRRVEIEPEGLYFYDVEDKLKASLNTTTGIATVTAVLSSEDGSELQTKHLAGSITSEQIEGLEAAKVVGKLSGKQIETSGLLYEVTEDLPTDEAEKGEMLFFNVGADEPENAAILVFNEFDLSDHPVGDWLLTIAAAGEPLNATCTVQSVEDAAKLHIFTITNKVETLTKAKYFSVEHLSGSGEFEAGEQVLVSFDMGALVADSITAAYVAAEAIGAEQIEAGSITAEKIVANTITSKEIVGETLSAIRGDLGEITAGTLTGVTFQTSASDPRVYFDDEGFHATDAEGNETFSLVEDGGLRLLASPDESVLDARTVRWEDSSANIVGSVAATLGSGIGSMILSGNSSGITTYGLAALAAYGKEEEGLTFFRAIASPEEAYCEVKVDGEAARILEEDRKSDFLQLPSTAKREINRGTATVSFGGGSEDSNTVTVEHGLGETPAAVVATGTNISSIEIINFATGAFNETTFKVQAHSEANRSGNRTCTWIAMT